MGADFGFGGRSEQRLVELRRLLITVAQPEAGDGTAFLIVLPAAADQVAPHDAFDRHDLRFADDHRPPLQVLHVRRQLRTRRDVGRNQVVRNVAHQVEPEERNLRQNLALARHAAGHDHVEGADPVGRNEEQRVAEVVDIAHLAAVDELHARNFGREQRSVRIVLHGALLSAVTL